MKKFSNLTLKNHESIGYDPEILYGINLKSINFTIKLS